MASGVEFDGTNWSEGPLVLVRIPSGWELKYERSTQANSRSFKLLDSTGCVQAYGEMGDHSWTRAVLYPDVQLHWLLAVLATDRQAWATSQGR